MWQVQRSEYRTSSNMADRGPPLPRAILDDFVVLLRHFSFQTKLIGTQPFLLEISDFVDFVVDVLR